tara:strand:- start:585 stop:872 length:288 start_codon:yes stop_codon:yes gene_type:complete
MANRYKMINHELVQLTDEEEAAKVAEEKAWTDSAADRNLNMLREQRNIILAESDWMSNSDVTMTDEWKKYRQELRDITKTYKSLEDVKWPTAPKG